MARLPLILTAAGYARLMPLATGMVQPEGIDLTLLLGRTGSRRITPGEYFADFLAS
jgi:hypothetical protein